MCAEFRPRLEDRRGLRDRMRAAGNPGFKTTHDLSEPLPSKEEARDGCSRPSVTCPECHRISRPSTRALCREATALMIVRKHIGPSKAGDSDRIETLFGSYALGTDSSA